ncbi:MAG: metal-dependent transcriptional regulator [Anaeroplasmataceae bacterium]|nr:metal-dependent transcriptional regulator [Anaeroplasmataceae bacterium]MDE6414571.1 metal-dependent transcriptional regulator [Anaeroplasmataceae bacterium]
MSLLESGENYLETILMLSKNQKEIHAIDVVNHLGFSKPSVSIMLKKLSNDGYLIVDEHSHIYLTEQGKVVAEKILNRHTYLTEFFIKIGVNPKTAEEDACKIEHDLSDETFNALIKLNNKI